MLVYPQSVPAGRKRPDVFSSGGAVVKIWAEIKVIWIIDLLVDLLIE